VCHRNHTSSGPAGQAG